jgi:FHS family glucose/mannose:H+ symporter-like MFS transporter
MTQQTRLATFTAVSMLILASVMTGLSASLLPIAGDFGIPASRAGILFSLHFAGFIVLITLSLLFHGLRRRLILVTATAGLYAVALVAAGLAPSFALLAVALLVAGGSGGVIESHTATLQVMTSRSSAEASRLVAFTQVFFAAGALLTPVYLSLGTAFPVGWRQLFLGLSVVGVIALLIGLTIRADRFEVSPRESGTFQWRPLLRVSIAMAFYVGAEVTLFGWAPTVMELYHGVPAVRARLAPTLFWIGILGGRLVVARLADPVGPERLLRVSALLGVVGSVLLVTVSAEPLLWTALVISALACAGIWPLIVATSDVAGHESGTTIVVAAGGVGATIFPFLAGLTSEVLPGRMILLMAAPLLLLVYVFYRDR